MKWIKLWENYIESKKESKYYKLALDYINKYYSDEDGRSPYGNYGEILNRVIDFVNTDFPYGLNNIPNPVILYRFLNVDSIKNINKDNLGKYYVGDKEMFNDHDFLESFFYRYGEENKKWFIVTIQTTESNIDIYDSLGNRAEYPDEYQISIKDDRNLKILNIEEIEPY